MPGEDCAICLHTIARPCLYKPCNHVVCRACAKRYLSYDIRCPMCRQVVQSLDPPAQTPSGARQINIHMDDSKRFGVVLVHADVGVAVKTVYKHSAAMRHGIQMHDVIVAVNSMPCYSVQSTLMLLKVAADLSSTVCVYVHRKANCYVQLHGRILSCVRWRTASSIAASRD